MSMIPKPAVLDWPRIDTVLLDMDGTILDLAFDNRFWLTLVPQAWGRERGLSAEEALDKMMPWFLESRGQLEWYCLDNWTRKLDLDVAALKRKHREHISVLPGAEDFLAAVRDSSRRLILVTNAHPEALALKNEETGIEAYFDAMISTHDYGAPKEDPRFWERFAGSHEVELRRSVLVDDSEPVLAQALASGVGQVCGILHPDSGQAVREPFGDWPHVRALADLTAEIG